MGLFALLLLAPTGAAVVVTWNLGSDASSDPVLDQGTPHSQDNDKVVNAAGGAVTWSAENAAAILIDYGGASFTLTLGSCTLQDFGGSPTYDAELLPFGNYVGSKTLTEDGGSCSVSWAIPDDGLGLNRDEVDPGERIQVRITASDGGGNLRFDESQSTLVTSDFDPAYPAPIPGTLMLLALGVMVLLGVVHTHRQK